MRTGIKRHKVIAVVAVVFAVATLNTGCWITRNWKDYMPITEIGLNKDVKSYSGYFYPKYTGGHALSLRIKSISAGKTQVGLRFGGTIRLYHDGRVTTIPFGTKIDGMTLPPTPCNLHIKEFDAQAIKRSDNDYGQFDVTIEGDLAGFLEREPESHLSVSFCDAE